MALRFPLESSRCIVPSRCVIRSSGPRCQRSPEALGVGRALDPSVTLLGSQFLPGLRILGLSPGFWLPVPRLARVCALSSGGCQLTPSGSRLGLTPSLRARPTRGTSLRSMLFFYGGLILYHEKMSYRFVQAGGPWGPRAKTPLGFCGA